MIWMAIGAGGAVGSMLRHAVNVAVAAGVGRSVPFATAIVNIVGCAVIGVLAASIESGSLSWGTSMRAFVFVGVLGGFTTFSSFGLDTLTLVRSGAMGEAIANVALQLVLGLGAVFAGYALAK